MTSHANHKGQLPNQDDFLPALSADSSVYDHKYVLEDINGCIHAAVPGFSKKFFEGKSWSSTLKRSPHL